jgi:biopolymer transport protein ExbD
MSSSSQESYEPNLTPILDMVFQLITFFMLVINFKASSLDLSLKLPVLGSARPLAYDGKHEPITLNFSADGTVRAYSQVVELDEFIAREARMLKSLLEADGTKPEDGSIPVPVIIRADQAVSFTEIMKTMQLCQSHGLGNIALSAMTREEEVP